MEDIEQILDIVKKELTKTFNPYAIILFGSYARKSQQKESDIDVAIIAENTDKKELFKVKQNLEAVLLKDIDLVNLNDEDISEGLRYEVLMNGIVIFCKDSYKFTMYKLDMCKEYLELNESRQDIIQRIKNGGTIYGK